MGNSGGGGGQGGTNGGGGGGGGSGGGSSGSGGTGGSGSSSKIWGTERCATNLLSLGNVCYARNIDYCYGPGTDYGGAGYRGGGVSYE